MPLNILKEQFIIAEDMTGGKIIYADGMRCRERHSNGLVSECVRLSSRYEFDGNCAPRPNINMLHIHIAYTLQSEINQNHSGTLSA